jgi:predicted ArsR family transcriptional regulator
MATDTLQQQARALGDPTRHAIFRHLAGARTPVGIAELNERFPVNHNAIRQHLAKLLAAGLVLESKESSGGRGRPRLVYEVNPAAEGNWGTAGPYERLSLLLVEIIRSGRAPGEVGREAADVFRAPASSGDPVADISLAMARQGFDPEVRRTDGGADVVLHNCPFATVAAADRETICALHLGIAQGLADDTAAAVTELVAFDPDHADCLLRITVDRPDRDTPEAPSLTISEKRSRRRRAPAEPVECDEGGEAPCYAHLLEE